MLKMIKLRISTYLEARSQTERISPLTTLNSCMETEKHNSIRRIIDIVLPLHDVSPSK